MTSGVSIEAFLIGMLGAVLAAFATFLFNRWAAQIGWNREDRRAQDGKIERVDQQARDSITRIERELTAELTLQGRQIEALKVKVEHLPTADDMEGVRSAVARVDSGLSAVTAKVEGTSEMVRTIRDHLMKRE